MRTKSVVIFILVLVALSACGGGNSPTDTAKTKDAPGTSVPATTPPAAAGRLAGTWAGTYVSQKVSTGKGGFTFVFTERGSELSGTLTLDAGCITKGTVSGKVNGDTIDFGAVKAHGGSTVSFTGSVAGDTMQGTYRSAGSCGKDSGTWTASRS